MMTTSNPSQTPDKPTIQNSEQPLANQSVLGEPEPWESWETSLCLWSIGIGIAALIVLGILVDWFLLPAA
ncbi:hypothetical protein [Nitrosomonas sp. ANs5]|uniref:hypothetical protein n=1 Tax=Nitrosomonas sp. ANs5 TaxID=3423941 RepID=UPI003D34DEAD